MQIIDQLFKKQNFQIFLIQFFLIQIFLNSNFC